MYLSSWVGVNVGYIEGISDEVLLGPNVGIFEVDRVGIIDGKTDGDTDGRKDDSNVDVTVGETVDGVVCSPKVKVASDKVKFLPSLISSLL